jgi:hypothetical protein
MKKLIVLTLALVLALSLVACGGNNDNSGNNSTGGNNPTSSNNGGNNNSGNNGGNNDKSDVDKVLAKYGLTLEDIKPENYVSHTVNVDKNTVYMTVSEATPAQSEAWVEKMITLAKSKSDDGEIYARNWRHPNQSDKKFDFENVVVNTYQPAFPYKGKVGGFSFCPGLEVTIPTESITPYEFMVFDTIDFADY